LILKNNTMKVDKNHRVPGIYIIRNINNKKVYVGKSKNVYGRISNHIAYLRIKHKDENIHLINSWHKYGEESFEYFIVEYLELDEELLSTRELYWMNIFNSLHKDTGYNLRSDSDSRCIIHASTSLKISNRLKKEWSDGLRKDHSEKLSKNWKNNSNRKIKQSELFTKTKTKYTYILYIENEKQFECDYAKLKELNLQHVSARFFLLKSDKVYHKGYIIERLKI
jgi:group I intron endonuclease